MIEHVRVGEVLRLDRVPVVPDPMTEYVAIGVRSFGRGIFHYEPRLGDQLGSLRFFEVLLDRLVISNIKSWEGAIAVSSVVDAGCIASNRFLTYLPIDDRIDVRWARWYFLSEPGIQLIQKASPGSADRNRTLAIDRFETLEIPLPSIDEQRRVAKRLDRLEAAASELRHRTDHAAALTAAFAVSASARPDLDDDAKAQVGWRHVALREVVDASTDQQQVEPGERYLIAGIFSFGRGLIDRGGIDGADTSYKVLTSLNKGDIVMSKLNGWEGAVAVVEPRFDGYYVSSEYPTFKADHDQLLPAFFSGIARSRWFWEALNSNARGSMVRRRRINATQFLGTEIWLPPMETQVQVAKQIQFTDQAAAVGERRRARVGALVPAALNRAFASLS